MYHKSHKKKILITIKTFKTMKERSFKADWYETKPNMTAHEFICKVINEIEEKIGHKLKMYNEEHEEYDFERDSADISPLYRLDDLVEGLKPFYVEDIEKVLEGDGLSRCYLYEYDGIKYVVAEGLDKIIFHSIRYAPQVYDVLSKTLGDTPIQSSGFYCDLKNDITNLAKSYNELAGHMYMND